VTIMSEISAELDALACDLIGAAIEVLEAKEQVPVMLALDCEDDILTFEDDTPDGCYRAARDYVHGRGKACKRYAMLYAGYVQEHENDPGSDALLIEFAEREMPCAWSGYVLYRTAADGAVEVTDPLPAGEEELLFG